VKVLNGHYFQQSPNGDNHPSSNSSSSRTSSGRLAFAGHFLVVVFVLASSLKMKSFDIGHAALSIPQEIPDRLRKGEKIHPLQSMIHRPDLYKCQRWLVDISSYFPRTQFSYICLIDHFAYDRHISVSFSFFSFPSLYVHRHIYKYKFFLCKP